MNSCNFIGRITKDHELKTINTHKGQMAVLEFTLAVNDRKRQDGTQDVNFINCKAFGAFASTIDKYTQKGSMLGITGSLKTSKYINKNNETRYKWEVLVEKISFCHGYSKGSTGASEQHNDELNIEDNDLPF